MARYLEMGREISLMCEHRIRSDEAQRADGGQRIPQLGRIALIAMPDSTRAYATTGMSSGPSEFRNTPSTEPSAMTIDAIPSARVPHSSRVCLSGIFPALRSRIRASSIYAEHRDINQVRDQKCSQAEHKKVFDVQAPEPLHTQKKYLPVRRWPARSPIARSRETPAPPEEE